MFAVNFIQESEVQMVRGSKLKVLVCHLLSIALCSSSFAKLWNPCESFSMPGRLFSARGYGIRGKIIGIQCLMTLPYFLCLKKSEICVLMVIVKKILYFDINHLKFLGPYDSGLFLFWMVIGIYGRVVCRHL